MSDSNNSIKLASINIEGDANLSRVADFLDQEKPDVVCFQELVETSLSFFEKTLGMKGHFLPMTKYHRLYKDMESPVNRFGLGLFSKWPLSEVHSDYYLGGTGDLPMLHIGDETTVWRGVLRATVQKDNVSYTVATTHFTRTSDGSTSETQRRDLRSLFRVLGDVTEIIVCGDFNAPRGGEIFGLLAEKYKDNIPAKYLSSLDPKLHQLRNSKLLMVDGLFSSPQYQVSNVVLSEAVSDHLAITGLISKL